MTRIKHIDPRQYVYNVEKAKNRIINNGSTGERQKYKHGLKTEVNHSERIRRGLMTQKQSKG